MLDRHKRKDDTQRGAGERSYAQRRGVEDLRPAEGEQGKETLATQGSLRKPDKDAPDFQTRMAEAFREAQKGAAAGEKS